MLVVVTASYGAICSWFPSTLSVFDGSNLCNWICVAVVRCLEEWNLAHGFAIQISWNVHLAQCGTGARKESQTQ